MDPTRTLVEENASLIAQIARLKASMAVKDADGLDLAQQIRFKADDLATMTRTLAARDEEIRILKAGVAVASIHYEQDAKTISALTTQVHDWQDQWLAKHCALKKQLERADDAEKACQEYKHHVRDLEDYLDDEHERIASLKEHVGKLESDKNVLIVQLVNVQEKLWESADDVKNAKISWLKQEVSRLDGVNRVMVKHMWDMQGRMNEQEEEVQQLRVERRKLRKSCKVRLPQPSTDESRMATLV